MKTPRISCLYVAVSVVCGIVVNLSSALFVVSLVIVPSPAPRLGRCHYCHQVGRMARECAQVWDPPPPVVVSTDIPVSSMAYIATVVEDDRVPETDPVDNSPDPEPSADLPVDNPPDPEPSADLPGPVKVSLSAGPDSEKLPTADPVPVKVSDKLPADNDVSMSRSFVTAKVFCARLSKTFDHIPFPNFNVIGKE